ncbi:hypothetical protein C8N35_10163 [Breoghania corrubedonensis]|uniref:Uncharacterized protein n=2 Tax=Breoghania corrubedonensis TaxID=665038 RepID=A0A2T5VE49_9HYPH|nr:hypothetical protein C8N35_10163 [Breoghania corrubedonensis]
MATLRSYELALTTQGPTYPPSELMNEDGDFVVIGRINRGRAADKGEGPVDIEIHHAHGTAAEWGAAIVAADSPVPPFGDNAPYRIRRELDLDNLTREDAAMALCTLPIPLPTNNYTIRFAPDQASAHAMRARPSYPLHAVPIPDLRPEDGLQRQTPITLGEWIAARGNLQVTVDGDGSSALFEMDCTGLIPNSLYTIMSLRERDFDPQAPTRPGPLGIPNVMITDRDGNGSFQARLPDPFPETDAPDGTKRNRVINVILLWMSYQMSHGGAIGLFGLGGDVHAQLKLPVPGFGEFVTRAGRS